MVTLEQIRQLDAKVAKAVELISQLRMENAALNEKLGKYQLRIDELEVLINDFKESQGEIEEGILHALQELDKLEHSITPEKKPGPGAAPKEEPAAEPEKSKAPPEDVADSYEDAEVDSDEDGDEEEKPGSELDIF